MHVARFLKAITDLEKLVALGEKMGLSGAELQKWFTQNQKAVETEKEGG